jgi:hypothetical protein
MRLLEKHIKASVWSQTFDRVTGLELTAAYWRDRDKFQRIWDIITHGYRQVLINDLKRGFPGYDAS